MRLRCLYLLASNGEVCVCELVDALRIPQPSISKSLHALKSIGVLIDRREANWTYYRLSPDMPDWVDTIVRTAVSELENAKDCRSDDKRFKRLALRPRELACP